MRHSVTGSVHRAFDAFIHFPETANGTMLFAYVPFMPLCAVRMKIDDIDAFVAVIRWQSISHAAESLQLTQPAITRRVQNFEQALGVELFDRNTKPLKPTPMGHQVYQKCLAILREMDALRELVASDTPDRKSGG